MLLTTPTVVMPGGENKQHYGPNWAIFALTHGKLPTVQPTHFSVWNSEPPKLKNLKLFAFSIKIQVCDPSNPKKYRWHLSQKIGCKFLNPGDSWDWSETYWRYPTDAEWCWPKIGTCKVCKRCTPPKQYLRDPEGFEPRKKTLWSKAADDRRLDFGVPYFNQPPDNMFIGCLPFKHHHFCYIWSIFGSEKKQSFAVDGDFMFYFPFLAQNQRIKHILPMTSSLKNVDNSPLQLTPAPPSTRFDSSSETKKGTRSLGNPRHDRGTRSMQPLKPKGFVHAMQQKSRIFVVTLWGFIK